MFVAEGNSQSPCLKGPLLNLGDALFPGDPTLAHGRKFELRSLRGSLQKSSLRFCRTGDVYQVPASQIMGLNSAGLTRYETTLPDTYVALLSSNCVLGRSRFIINTSADLLAFHDELSVYLNDTRVTIKDIGAKKVSKNSIFIGFKREFSAHIASGIHLMHEYSHNYFHFVVEVLPRLLNVKQALVASNVPYLVDENLHQNFLYLLGRLNKEDRPVIYIKRNFLHKVDDLFFPSDTAQILDCYEQNPDPAETYLPVSELAVIRNLLLSSNADCSKTARRRKIYLSRSRGLRMIVNESELIQQLLSRGFEIISTEELSIDAQVALFHSAEVIVAPSGAALTNIIWCQRDCRVLVLASDHPALNLNIWRALACVSGVQIDFFLGRRSYRLTAPWAMHDDYTIDIQQLKEAL
jgi:capsular polysaccharide biosynthesis protein